MKTILAGFDLDAIPDPTASRPRCLPSYGVTFTRGSGEVAHASFFCSDGATAPASVGASFTAFIPGTDDALASGAITIDPRPIVNALDAPSDPASN